MIVTGSITRTELSLPNLDINDKNGYEISSELEGFGISWRRVQAESPYLDGKYTVGRVKEQQESRLAFEVTANSHTALATKVKALIDAFTQTHFTITLALDAQSYAWYGECADYAMSWDKERLFSYRAKVVFMFLRHPVPAGGIL